METVTDFTFLGSKSTADGEDSHEIKRCLLLGRKAMTNVDSILKSRDITWLTKVRLVKAMIFSVVMFGCESGTIKKVECQRIDAFELWCWRNSWESLGLQGDPTSQLEGTQSWIFIGRTDAATEAPILWPPDAKSQLTGKDPDAEKDWRQEEEDDRGWDGWRHHWLDGHKFDQVPGIGDGQGSLVYCNPLGGKELEMTERLNWLISRLGNWTHSFFFFF